MKTTKILGPALAAALMAASMSSFGQAGSGDAGSAGAAGSGGIPDRGTGAPAGTMDPNVNRSGSATAPAAASTGTSSVQCDSLTGAEKMRCQHGMNASQGSTGDRTTGSGMTPNTPLDPIDRGVGHTPGRQQKP